MRRALLAGLLTATVLFGTGSSAAAPPDPHERGPACADITGLGGLYQPGYATGGAGVYSPTLALAGPSCPGLTYTVSVLDGPGDTVPLASRSLPGDKSGSIAFGDMEIAVADGDPAVCVFATSSAGERVFDRSPADGCVVLDPVLPCTEITLTGGTYVVPPSLDGGVYSPLLTLAGPACPGITYTVYVLDGHQQGAALLASQSVQGSIAFEDMAIAVKDGDPAVCVYATSQAGDRVYDRNPFDGCGAVYTILPGNCADIEKIGGNYRPGDGEREAGLFEQPALALAAPGCSDVTYTIYVLDNDSRLAPLLGSQSVRGDERADVVVFDDMEIFVEDGDPAVCIYATSERDGEFLNRIPARGCVRSDDDGRTDYWWFP